MARCMQIRPSELLQVTDAYEAWCLDEAIWLLGQKMQRGDRLALPKSSDNSELLKKLGVK